MTTKLKSQMKYKLMLNENFTIKSMVNYCAVKSSDTHALTY